MRFGFKTGAVGMLAGLLLGAVACSGGSSDSPDVTGDVADVKVDVGECTEDAQCTTENVCMQGTCESGACVFAAKTGSTCDDGDRCTLEDQCSSEGSCVGTAKVCDDGIFCNGPETCDAASGECVAGVAPTVDDAVDCTLDECNEDEKRVDHTPQNGECVTGNACVWAMCDPVKGCVYTPDVGKACDDGDLCTTGGTCDDEGTCVGTATACDDGLFCNGIGTCDPLTGDCAPGAPAVVDDGIDCTVDTCAEGMDGATVVNTPDHTLCEDGNACTENLCDMDAGCQVEKRTGVACDDGNPCTGGDNCVDGVCTAGTTWLCPEICDGGIDEDLDGLTDYFDPDCWGDALCPEQNGDTCQGPLALLEGPVVLNALPVGVRVTGSTLGMADDFTYECGGDVYPDVVYSFVLGTPAVVTAALTPADALSRATLTLVKQFCVDGDVLDCEFGPVPEVGGGLMPGAYFLVVNQAHGAYTLDVQFVLPDGAEAACDDSLDNDLDGLADCDDPDCYVDEFCVGKTCETALPLTDGVALDASLIGGDAIVVTGSTIGMGQNYVLGCDDLSASGEDVVYSFDVTEPVFLTFELEYDSLQTFPAMAIMSGACDEWMTVSCVSPLTSDPLALAGTLPAGSYHVVMDAAFGGGTYTLTVTAGDTPLTEIRCHNGLDDDLDGDVDCDDVDCQMDLFCLDPYEYNNTLVTAWDAGDITDTGFQTEGASIWPLGDVDAFLVTLDGPGFVTLDVQPGQDATQLDVWLHVFDGEGFYLFTLDDNWTAGGESQTYTYESGSYFIQVAGYESTGTYALTIDVERAATFETDCFDGIDNDLDGLLDCADDDCGIEPACEGESCAFPFLLNEGNPISGDDDGLELVVQGDTTEHQFSFTGSCVAGSADAPDQAYRLEVGAPVMVFFSFVYDDTFWNWPTLMVYEGGCLPENEIFCGDTTGTPVQGSKVLQPGTYYFIADGADGYTEGSYTLTVSFMKLQETETDCFDGIDNDGNGLVDCCDTVCALEPACLTETRCTDGKDSDCDGLVDCKDPDCGIEASCKGQSCAIPFFVFDRAIKRTDNNLLIPLTGDTSTATNDYALECPGFTGSGKDHVYAFELEDTMILTATMDFDASYFWPAVYVLTGPCNAGSVVACHGTRSGGGPALISGRVLQPGTYYVIVDSSYSSDNGPYYLNLLFNTVEETETRCTDGIDNDGDGFKDCCDDDCAEDVVCLAETQCADGIDNDCDGLVDCNDLDCKAEVACLGENCEAPLPLIPGGAAVPANGGVFNVSGTTAGRNNSFGLSCLRKDGETADGLGSDVVYSFTLNDALWARFKMDFNTTWNWPGLFLVGPGCDAGGLLACHWTKFDGGPAFIPDMELVPGTYFLIVDAVYSSDNGPFDLAATFSALSANETNCTDGVDDDGDGATDCCDDHCFLDDVCLAETMCGDGKDNDCDGKVDCDDPDCDADAACMIHALPFFEDVEHDGEPPLGWFTETPSADCTWSVVYGGADGTEYSAQHGYSWDCDDEEPSLLVSPWIDVAGCSTLSVSFWEKGAWQDDRWYHGVGAWDGTTMVHVEHNQDAPADFQKTAAPIPIDLTGMVSPVRFFFAYAGSYADDWWVDQLSITCQDN